MRYAFFSTGSWEGNASMVRLREFGRELVARGVDVTYAVDDVPYNRQKLGVDPRARIVYTGRVGGIGQVRARRRTVRGLGADVVHVLNPAPKTWAGLWGTGQRVVGDWDEWPMMRAELGWRYTTGYGYLDRWLRGRADPAVVASRYMQREFKARFGVDAAYVPYAAYLPDYPPTESPYAEPTAVYMGSFFPAYDHDLVLEAAVLLKARGRTPRITLLGSGPDLEKWRAFVADRGLTNVSLPGWSSGLDLWRHLRHAHALLFPIRENIVNLARCPSKTFAYAQARRPVLAGRVGEVAEVLGEVGTYVDPTPAAWADAIDAAMSAPAPADVDYRVERHNWAARTNDLLAAVERRAP